jgi:hypothetical protein
MKAAIETADGVFEVDLDEEELLDFTADERLERPTTPKLSLPLLVAVAAVGATVVAIVDRRPPLAVSHDAGSTWRERGGGLPRGVAVAIGEDDPDIVLYAARNRLFLSRDGGRFWRALTLELPEILAVELRA